MATSSHGSSQSSSHGAQVAPLPLPPPPLPPPLPPRPRPLPLRPLPPPRPLGAIAHTTSTVWDGPEFGRGESGRHIH
eukprot:scaffold56739_cov66-Phaeocystis_antarctica.AAC.3